MGFFSLLIETHVLDYNNIVMYSVIIIIITRIIMILIMFMVDRVYSLLSRRIILLIV